MRLAALYDIHANLPALDAVMAEVHAAAVDAVVLGGDVALGPLPAETMEFLRSLALPVHCIRGNCDRGMLEAPTGVFRDRLPKPVQACLRWTAGELPLNALAWMRSWPLTVELEMGALGRVVFCHATPRDDNDIFVAATPEVALQPAFDTCTAPLVVCGHTHMQFDRRLGVQRIVNAGSVGMPIGTPGADWLLLDADTGSLEFRHTDYDLAAAADRIRATAFPDAAGFADRDVLQPRPRAEMESLFLERGLR